MDGDFQGPVMILQKAADPIDDRVHVAPVEQVHVCAGGGAGCSLSRTAINGADLAASGAHLVAGIENLAARQFSRPKSANRELGRRLRAAFDDFVAIVGSGHGLHVAGLAKDVGGALGLITAWGCGKGEQ